MIYDSLKGTHLKQADKILSQADKILHGTMLSIDPSSKSMGWALYEKGEYVKGGVAKGDGPIGERLKQIYENLPDYDVNILLTELVRTNTGHYMLVWSNGTALAKYGPEYVVEISTGLWKKTIDEYYYKSDVTDAKYLGKFAVDLCREAEKNEHS